MVQAEAWRCLTAALVEELAAGGGVTVVTLGSGDRVTRSDDSNGVGEGSGGSGMAAVGAVGGRGGWELASWAVNVASWVSMTLRSCTSARCCASASC